jgi:glutamate 5-kinase
LESLQKQTARRDLGQVRRLVVKVGSGVIARGGKLRPKAIADLAYEVAVLRHQGYEVVMVVSGAVAAGYEPLGFDAPPKAVVERQAASSVGQHRLMATIAKLFMPHRIHVAQLLMCGDDIDDRRRFISARHTMQMLIAHGVVPIINENDALSDDEAKVGDNDHLAALVTNVISADLLVILSGVEGVYRNGSGEVIPQVDVGSSIDEHITSAISESGVGGMAAKVSAARLASHWGVSTIIAAGRLPRVLQRVLAGEPIGTIFMPRSHHLNQRKRWIAFRSRSHGVIRVDEGAKTAIIRRGASLLPSGIVQVEGDFPMGARVELQGEDRVPFAVGLVSYAADEVRRLRGKKKTEIKTTLGYEYLKEIIDRDDLVLLDE